MVRQQEHLDSLSEVHAFDKQIGGPMSVAVTLTVFPNMQCQRAETLTGSWGEIFDFISGAPPIEAKDTGRLLKLAKFGDARTPRGSLKHDANVLEITGVEGDYDAESVGIEEAVSLLEKAGVRAFVHPSWSHAPEKPRWRVLAPLSKPLPPSEHNRMVERLNGALGGILAPES